MMNILIVDDHFLIRKGVRMLLERWDAVKTIEEADNGTDAIVLAEQKQPDVVLLDLSMPEGLDGFTAAQNIHKTVPNAKIIVLTMHDEEAYIQKALQLGISGYLLKNSESNELQEAIEAVMRGERYYRTRIPLEQLEKMEASDSRKSVLTPREQEVLRLVTLGYTNIQIGEQLVISPKTVERHKSNMMQKLQLQEIHELIQYGIKNHVADLV
ncbi:response regulator transcription factor [Savagea sp. SN6]|uniref:Response regulator transcription factor n=1 Tax=Savagea serpentis TaxID=2785297 RepID=A0A8J7KF14_9BACL|nr:response regulator transcription factor [Savagea serpentis]MBF4501746.1 response regulator transcription factor [Savagea serpentis]